ncbi:hypothetical protein Trydic_g22646 [Trypoxylus dichotomus]
MITERLFVMNVSLSIGIDMKPLPLTRGQLKAVKRDEGATTAGLRTGKPLPSGRRDKAKPPKIRLPDQNNIKDGKESQTFTFKSVNIIHIKVAAAVIFRCFNESRIQIASIQDGSDRPIHARLADFHSRQGNQL